MQYVTLNAVLNCSNVCMFQILSKADSLGVRHFYTGQHKIVHDFACLLEGHMQAIPEDSWHEFQIDCLNLVHCYRQRRQLFKQPEQSSLSATFTTPVTPLCFLAGSPESVNSSLEGISPSTLYTSKELDTPPVQQVSPDSPK